MTQPTEVTIRSLSEMVATAPSFMGYIPDPGDVAIVMSRADGSIPLVANIPDESWETSIVDSADASNSIMRAVEDAEAQSLLVVGYGVEGEHRALGLADAASKKFAGDFTVCGVNESQFREIGHGFTGQWVDQVAPNRALAVDSSVGEPAANHDALVEQYSTIDTDVPEGKHIDEARQYIEMLPNNAGEQAAAAMELLRTAGPGSTPYTRALIGELVSQSKNVRDACMVDMLGDNPPDLENLTYVARASNEQHRAEVSALAAGCHFFDGDPTAVDTFAERSQDTTLGKLLLMAREQGLPPTPELRSALHSSGKEAQSLPADPEQSASPAPKPERSQRPSTSVPGVDPLSGPSSGPGLGGVDI